MTELNEIISKFNSSTDDEKFTIFSKENCQWCESAKELLDERDDASSIDAYNYFDCTEILKTNKPEFINEINKLSGVEIKTFPIIFKGKKYIGGFQELRRYLN
jgi:glutaredoxin